MLGILFLSILFFGGSNYYSIFLAMFYNPSASLAYASIMYINNEIYYGWWMRALHANGASWFFLVIYLHMDVVFTMFLFLP